MRIKIEIYPDAGDEYDCVPENMSYKAFSTSWENAEGDLERLKRICEKDAEALAKANGIIV